MQSVAITGAPRTTLGKKGTRTIRREGMIPAVLYGGDDVIHFSTTANDVKDLIYTPDLKLAKIEIEGKTYNAIVKDVQFHPVTDDIIHLDFLRLVDGVSVRAEVPVRVKGQSPGVKSGGKLIKLVRRVKIKTTPENLIDEVRVDISTLKLGTVRRVRDIDLPEGVEIMNSPGIPVVSVQVPRMLRSATAAAEKEAAGKPKEAPEAEGEGEEGTEAETE